MCHCHLLVAEVQPAADGCSELTALWLCSGEALRKTLAVTVAVSILLQSYLHCVVAPVPKYASIFFVCLLFLSLKSSKH